MSPEAQRIAIAEACGWEIPPYCITKRRMAGATERQCKGAPPDFGKDPSGAYRRSLPDYPNDLNAMHEAEKMLSSKTDNGFGALGHSNQRGRYEYQLQGVTRSFEIWHATAAQRAEAFLRTIGKWEAQPPAHPTGHTEGEG